MTPHSPKRRRLFDKVKEYKDRFRLESSDALKKRAATGSLYKEAAIAIREILAERENGDPDPN